ncbi:ESPR-type extended signal peptide-containing protein [Paraburkholderia sp. A1RI-2L]|uniref:ESPR-type extended signal peptide-containing protein n=1 Tax=Paraburkholderia sp. A1RI-2L TaxID=3028367 RepID=UPI003B8203B9
MNKTYRSVWSETDQTWVAAPETATAHRKSSRRLAVLATGAVGFAAGLSSATTGAATLTPAQLAALSAAASTAKTTTSTTTGTTVAPVPGTVGQGGLEICSGTSGYSWGSSGGSQSLDCSSGSGTSDGLAFSLNNAADAKGGYGFGASTAQVAGYQNGTLAIRGASVMVYGPTTFDSVVTMSNQKIVQLAPGKISADSTDAVNGSQLYALSVGVGNAVQYDSPEQDSVTLGGAAAMNPVALHNVANGELSAASTDAVNGGQLYATNSSISNLAGDVTNIQGDITNINGKLADAVVYDSSAHDSLTLGGTDASAPVALHNVANGELSAASTDAVNGGQLYATNSSISNLAGDVTNIQGDITNINGKLADAVVYDSSAHDSLTLGGTDASAPVALHNVANGELSAASTDAVNGGQLYATNSSISNLAGDVTNIQGDITNINGKLADAVVYDSSAHDSLTLGGTDASAPVALHNVANGELSAASTDAVNGGQLYATNSSISNLAGDVTNIQGDITNINGKLADAVVYDSSAHDSLTLGGTDASAPVALHNVANGELSAASTDAVNGGQLYATNSSISNLAGDVTNIQGDITNINGKLADAVVYDSSAHDSLTLGGTDASAPVALHNVANGELSAASTDAVNGGQLYATNSSISNLAGDVTNIQGDITNINGKLADAVVYDSSAHDSLTLGGTDASAPVALHNVANGELSAASTDAVNGGQLYATNSSISNLAGDVTNIQGDITNINGKLADAVVYDSSAHDSLTLGGTDASAPVALHNVANGELSAASTDAVNGGQLYATNSSISNLAGDVTNIQGDITNINGKLADAVVYDSSAHDSVTLGNASDMKPVGLHNVANGEVSVASTDAINGSQLYDAIQKFDSKSTHYVGINSTPNDGNYNGEGATGTAAIAVGANALASGDNALAIGTGATASHSDAVALGAGSTTEAAIATTDATIGGQDYTFAGSNPASTVSIGSVGNERTLTNVAAGRLSASSTDAVNGSQLYATNSALDNLAQQTSNIVQYDDTSKSTITFGGAQGTKLTNVAAGDVSVSSTDAVNGAQLYDVKEGANIAITKINNTLTTAGWGAQAVSSDPTGYTYGGFIMDASGKVSNPAVLYVPNTIGTSASQIVLDPGQGNSPYFVNGSRSQYLPKGTVISNVANGLVDTDAASVGQVYDIVSAATGGGLQSTLLRSQAPDPANGSSGVNAAGLTRTYTTAAYYSQVSGLADSSGSRGPSDAARASGAGSIAIGSNAFTPSANGVAVGVQAFASAKDAVAIGAGSVANQSNTVSVGNDGTGSYIAYDANGQVQTIQNAVNTRRIVNLAAGQGDTDAVNVGQLRSVAAALGGGAGINAAGGLIAPSYSVGGTTVNTVGDAIANLDNRVQKNTAEIAALAADATSSSATVQSASSTAAAAPVVQMAAAPRSLLGTSTAGSNSVRSMAAVGDTSSSTDADAVHYDNADHSSVTLASTSGGNVKLSGLSNGALSLDSTDAVTGQQLYATNQQVDSLNQALQNISVGGSTATSINSTSGVAAASGSQSVAVGGGAVATGASSTAIGDKANASANNAVAIGANSIANRDNAVSVGAEGSERQIVNVAAGTSGTDAVNLNQLNNAMAQQSNAFGQQIGNLQNSINTVSKNAYAGVAAAMAMPNLTPSGPGRTVVAAGGGYYMGGSAAAVGVTYRSANAHWLVNGGVSVTSTGNTAARAQVGYEF